MNRIVAAAIATLALCAGEVLAESRNEPMNASRVALEVLSPKLSARVHLVRAEVARGTARHEGWSVDPLPATGSDGIGVVFPERLSADLLVFHGADSVVLRPLGARNRVLDTGTGLVRYDGGYESTDVVYTVRPDRVEEFLFLGDRRAPSKFEYEVVDSAGIQGIEPWKGGIRFRGAEGDLRIESPYVVEANGKIRDDVARWSIERSGARDRLVLTIDFTGLDFPIVVDPTWTLGSSMWQDRRYHTATALPNGNVLAVGGQTLSAGSGYLSSCELYDSASDRWRPAASLPLLIG